VARIMALSRGERVFSTPLLRTLIMRTAESRRSALAGILLATCLASGPAQATSLPVIKNNAPRGAVTIIGERGGHDGVGFAIRGYGYHGYGLPYYGYVVPYYDYYGLPYADYGPNAGWCDWYYRNAIATGSSYWSDRYFEKCTGY
jgi:hypothetical protein